jgi:hypothetical protein
MFFRTARILRAYAHSHARLIMSARDARGPEELDDRLVQPDIELMFDAAHVLFSRMRQPLRQDGAEG